jgi:hypothetical protein
MNEDQSPFIADNLSKTGWSWGYVSAVDSNGRTIFVANAHHDDGKRFVVRADEKLTAFLELESGISRISVRERVNGLMAFGSAYQELAWRNAISARLAVSLLRRFSQSAGRCGEGPKRDRAGAHRKTRQPGFSRVF